MHPIHKKIFEINRIQSGRYVADEAARKRYWAKHTTFVGCIKCMDGRVNLPIMTNTPVGIVKPFRAIGGKFEAWWPSFLGRLRYWTEKALANGSRCCLLITYHYSASDSHLGCAGWKYDMAAARAHAEKLAKDLQFIFGEELAAIVTGVETDLDVLILHGVGGDISGLSVIGKNEDEIITDLQGVLPGLSPSIYRDLSPFLVGNAKRVQEIKNNPRTSEAKQHDESIIAIGQGFGWLVEENLALIINDADPNLAESINVAASLIEKNLADEPEGSEATIFANIPYKEPGVDYRQAVARAKGLLEFAESVIKKNKPELIASGRLRSLATVMWEPSKKIEVIES